MRANIVLGNGERLRIFGVIKGLSTERDSVRSEFARGRKPDFIALSISPEELKGLREYREGEDDKNIVLTDYEEIYAQHLRKWGDIEIPPPCYTEALRISNDEKTRIGAIDMDEDSFTNAYCAYISGTQLVRHSLRKSILRNFEIKAETPEEFVLKWDAKVNKISGYRRLEEKREQHMAKRLVSISERYKDVLAFIELERSRGVAEKIKKLGKS
jgi:pheromone shutdown protein TraB